MTNPLKLTTSPYQPTQAHHQSSPTYSSSPPVRRTRRIIIAFVVATVTVTVTNTVAVTVTVTVAVHVSHCSSSFGDGIGGRLERSNARRLAGSPAGDTIRLFLA